MNANTLRTLSLTGIVASLLIAASPAWGSGKELWRDLGIEAFA